MWFVCREGIGPTTIGRGGKMAKRETHRPWPSMKVGQRSVWKEQKRGEVQRRRTEENITL